MSRSYPRNYLIDENSTDCVAPETTFRLRIREACEDTQRLVSQPLCTQADCWKHVHRLALLALITSGQTSASEKYFTAPGVQYIKVTPSRAHTGHRGEAELQRQPIFNLGTRRAWVVRTTPRPLYPQKTAIPPVQETVWTPGPLWTGAENLAPTGIPTLDRLACNQSLYRLSYPGRRSKAQNTNF